MRAVILGTSSARPTLHRNVSGTVVEIEGESVLFDCGEGTQRQALYAGIRFSRLKLIAITHLHGDHVNGLFGLLGTLILDGRSRPLTIVGPPGIGRLLQAGRALRLFSPQYDLEVGEFRGSEEVFRGDGYRVVSEPLDHSVETLGYAVIEDDRPGRFDVEQARSLGVPAGPLYGQLQHGNDVTLADGTAVTPADVLGPTRPGRRIAYCLDTRPCEGAVRLARSATLLIHESTFGDEATAEAAAYAHSTARQAAQTARAAGARQLVLTHFSSRYDQAGAECLLGEARQLHPATSLAADLATYDLGPVPD